MFEVQRKRVAPIVQQQKSILLEFLEKHEELSTGKFSTTFSQQFAQKLWKEVTTILNTVPGGSRKNWRQWRKTWQDIKKNTKAKAMSQAMTNKKYTAGGGSAIVTIFDETESKVLSLISRKTTFGDDSDTVPTVTFDFDQVSSDGSDEDVGVDQAAQFEFVEIAEENMDTEGSIDRDCQNLHDNISDEVQVQENISQKAPKLRRKFTKSKRLKNSLGISPRLIKIEEEKKTSIINFYKAKTEYLEWRKSYEKEKLQILKNSNSIKYDILQELKEIRHVLI